jgi:formate dehydrogenase maturation protein FdhE
VEIARPDEKTIVLSQLDLFFVELLRQIPLSADPQDSDAARERLFSLPVGKGEESEFCEEWKSYVEPGLRHLFQSSTKTVKADLEKFREIKNESETSYALHLPVSHLDAWLNSLNQARLALAARFDFTEKELEGGCSPNLESVRDLSLLQIHLYGFLQEIFLREMR